MSAPERRDLTGIWWTTQKPFLGAAAGLERRDKRADSTGQRETELTHASRQITDKNTRGARAEQSTTPQICVPNPVEHIPSLKESEQDKHNEDSTKVSRALMDHWRSHTDNKSIAFVVKPYLRSKAQVASWW